MKQLQIIYTKKQLIYIYTWQSHYGFWAPLPHNRDTEREDRETREENNKDTDIYIYIYQICIPGSNIASPGLRANEVAAPLPHVRVHALGLQGLLTIIILG